MGDMPSRCDVCGLAAQPSQLAALPAGTGHVHVDHWQCIPTFLTQVPEPGEGDPPAEFTAARLRAERLAAVTGRPRPNLGEPRRHVDSGVWHWPPGEE